MKKTKSAVAISIVVVGIFGVMQAMETQAINTSSLTLSTTVSSVIGVNCLTTTLTFPNFVPGSPQDLTTQCDVTTNANGGYHMQVKHDDATGTMKSGAVYIPDAAAWTGANSALWGSLTPAQSLAFRVAKTTGIGTTAASYNSTWWGTDDAAAAKFAGLPAVLSQDIVTNTTYSSAATHVILEFKVDVPPTQQTLTYAGTVTVSTTATP